MMNIWKKSQQPIGICPNCGKAVFESYPYTWCQKCSKRLPEEIQSLLPKLDDYRSRLAGKAVSGVTLPDSSAPAPKYSIATGNIISELRNRAESLRLYAGFFMSTIIVLALVGILIFATAGYTALAESSPGMSELHSVAESLGVIREYLLSSDVNRMRQIQTLTDADKVKMRDELSHLDNFDLNIQNGLRRLPDDLRENKIPVIVSAVSQRVGIIVLLIFLLQILVPHYRYNIKLAGFYSARADALEILSKLPDYSLDKLIPILSPETLEFGRTIPSPAEHAMEMLREIAKLARSATDSK